MPPLTTDQKAIPQNIVQLNPSKEMPSLDEKVSLVARNTPVNFSTGYRTKVAPDSGGSISTKSGDWGVFYDPDDTYNSDDNLNDIYFDEQVRVGSANPNSYHLISEISNSSLPALTQEVLATFTGTLKKDMPSNNSFSDCAIHDTLSWNGSLSNLDLEYLNETNTPLVHKLCSSESSQPTESSFSSDSNENLFLSSKKAKKHLFGTVESPGSFYMPPANFLQNSPPLLSSKKAKQNFSTMESNGLFHMPSTAFKDGENPKKVKRREWLDEIFQPKPSSKKEKKESSMTASADSDSDAELAFSLPPPSLKQVSDLKRKDAS